MLIIQSCIISSILSRYNVVSRSRNISTPSARKGFEIKQISFCLTIRVLTMGATDHLTLTDVQGAT